MKAGKGFGEPSEELRREYVFLTLIYTFGFVLGNKAEWKVGGAGDEKNAGRDVKVEAGTRERECFVQKHQKTSP